MVHYRVDDKLDWQIIQAALQKLQGECYSPQSDVNEIAIMYVALNDEALENQFYFDEEEKVIYIRIVLNFVMLLHLSKEDVVEMMRSFLVFSTLAIKQMFPDFKRQQFEQDLYKAFRPTAKAA